jgi:hypothetical protein
MCVTMLGVRQAPIGRMFVFGMLVKMRVGRTIGMAVFVCVFGMLVIVGVH